MEDSSDKLLEVISLLELEDMWDDDLDFFYDSLMACSFIKEGAFFSYWILSTMVCLLWSDLGFTPSLLLLYGSGDRAELFFRSFPMTPVLLSKVLLERFRSIF